MAQLLFGRGAASEKEAREDTSHDTSEAEDKTRKMTSHEVEGEASSDTDTVKEQEDEAQEHTTIAGASEPAQDAPRWTASGVETYAIQCNACFKWRIIPSKDTYETIGEHILQKPFVCIDAQEWRYNANCDEPTDIDDNEPTVVWAIDKHNIPRPPDGFYRKVVLRTENSKKFADIYYKTPCGKTLRSLVNVQKYLEEHPEINAKKEQFCFTSPKGRTDALAAGVSTKRLLKNETQLSPRKRIKGNPEMKTPGHGQPPRHQSLIRKGPLPKSASKLNAAHQDKSNLKQLHGLKGSPHPMTIKREKLEADRGAR